jgi:hypothetical protein
MMTDVAGPQSERTIPRTNFGSTTAIWPAQFDVAQDYQQNCHRDKADPIPSSKGASQACKSPGDGAPELEVTPAMLEAGIEALWSHDREAGISREIVRDVFLAMDRARSSPKSASSWLEQ